MRPVSLSQSTIQLYGSWLTTNVTRKSKGHSSSVCRTSHYFDIYYHYLLLHSHLLSALYMYCTVSALKGTYNPKSITHIYTQTGNAGSCSLPSAGRRQLTFHMSLECEETMLLVLWLEFKPTTRILGDDHQCKGRAYSTIHQCKGCSSSKCPPT